MIVYTDGSCKKNKRVKDISKQPKGGIGIYWGDDNSFNVSESFTLYPVTNIRTELYACIKAIEIFYEHFSETLTIDRDYLIIYTDSKFTINAMTIWVEGWKKNNWKKADGKPVQNIDLISRLDELINRFPNKIRFEHIRAHQKEPFDKSSDEYKHWYGNMMADKLATNY